MASSRGEKEANKIINQLNLPTQIRGKPPNTPLTEQSFIDIWELELDVNSKEPKVLISGNDTQIVLQTSLLNALNQLLAYRGISAFNWKEWVESFEGGFKTFTKDASPELKKLWEKEVYPGVTKDNRPKIVELHLDARTKKTSSFKTVQFFPDRKNVNDWLLFTGNYKDIANKIESWWYQKSGSTAMSNKGGALPYLKGMPLIKLYFIQPPDKVAVVKNKILKPVRGEISFRIMDKSDNPNSGLDLLSKTDLDNYAKRIVENLGGENPFIWEKGKAIISYRNRKQGFEGWYPIKNKASGLELIKRLLAITGLTVNKTSIKYSETEEADKAYPTIPGKVKVLGEEFELARQRPIADVTFQSAEIMLPTIQKTIPLVRMGYQIYKPKS